MQTECPKVYVSSIKPTEVEILDNFSIDGVYIEIDNIDKKDLKSILKLQNIQKIFITRVIDFKNIELIIDNVGKNITLQIQDPFLLISTLTLIKKHFKQTKLIAPVNVNFNDWLDNAIKMDNTVDYIFVCAQHKDQSKLLENWQKAAIINLKTQKPIILAGGLNADNVKQAIKIVKPFGVSVISSVKKMVLYLKKN